MGIGAFEFILLLLVILLFFGGKRLPELGRSFGKSLVNFKKELKDKDQE